MDGMCVCRKCHRRCSTDQLATFCARETAAFSIGTRPYGWCRVRRAWCLWLGIGIRWKVQDDGRLTGLGDVQGCGMARACGGCSWRLVRGWCVSSASIPPPPPVDACICTGVCIPRPYCSTTIYTSPYPRLPNLARLSPNMASVTSLDQDMKRLRMDRYTPQAANQVRSWIEGVLGETLPAGDLLDALKDGTVLCRYDVEARRDLCVHTYLSVICSCS